MGLFKSPMKRLHHNAYVTADMEATRHFYEDLIGMPLIATWCESDVLFGKERTYCHCFFGLEDDSALAFFQFANPEDQREFGPHMPASPFHHIALHCDGVLATARELLPAIPALGEEGMRRLSSSRSRVSRRVAAEVPRWQGRLDALLQGGAGR